MTDPQPLILLVNDDRDMLALTAAQVRQFGYPEPITTEDAESALELIRRHRPSLVITDVSMPAIDGFQLCRILKSPLFPGSESIPVILTSATFRDVMAEQVARNVKALAYLQLPHDAATLKRLIDVAHQRALPIPGERCFLNYAGTIAVIDDDPDMVRLLQGALEENGWCVFTAADGDSAKALLQRAPVHLVLLDYHIPNGNGLELLRWLRVHRPDAVVIIITADLDEDLLITLVKSGADDYLRKPLNPTAVIHACRNALNKYHFLRIHEQFKEKIETLRSVTEYLDMVINYSQEAIFSCDLEGRVRIWNKGAEKMYGYTSDEIVGKVVDDFLDPPEHTRKSPEVVKILHQRGGSFVEPEISRRRKDGTVFPVFATYSSIYNAAGEDIGFSVIERDVTTQHALDVEKIRSARLRAITQTAVTANDQINTPLGVILGYAQFLQKKVPDLAPEDTAALEIIQQQVQRIKGIMNKLKLMSDPIVKNYSIEGVTMLDLARSK